MNAAEILEALDAGHAMLNAAEQRNTHAFPWRASATGGCARKSALLAAGAHEAPLSTRSIRTFHTGTDAGIRHANALALACAQVALEGSVHVPLQFGSAHDVETILRAFESSRYHDDSAFGWKSLFEPPIKRLSDTELGLLGHFDALVRDGGETTLIDFKTKHPWAFKGLRKKGMGRDYLAQILGYKRGLERAEVTVSRCLVIFEAKDSHDLLALDPYEDPSYSETLLDECLAETAQSLLMWAQGDATSVPPTFDPTSDSKLDWHCNYCPVGPVTGGCFPGLDLRNKASQGQAPNWVIR